MIKLLDTVYSLAPSPQFEKDGICFAACHSGLYRSEDGGLTWHPAYKSLDLEEPLTTTSVAVSSDFKNDRSVFAGVSGCVLRSFDGGQNWEIVPLPSPPPHISSLVVSPYFSHDSILFAGTLEDGVFRSSDRGSHWAAWNFGLLDLNTLCLVISPDFCNDETLFLGTDSGIFISTNGGRAWRETNFPSEFAPVISLALSPDYASDGVLFAGTEYSGLYYSEDRGRRWTRLGEELITAAVNAIILSPFFPGKQDVLITLDRALLISRDGGRSWSPWKDDLDIKQNIISAAAPLGLYPDAPLLVGYAEEGVHRI